MTDIPVDSARAAWPPSFEMTRRACPGAQAQGCVIARSDLAEAAEWLVPRAPRYSGLQLTLGHDEAVFWSPQPVALPWLPVPVTYLQPPRRKVFLPVGWSHALSSDVLEHLLSKLVPGAGFVAPLVLWPHSPAAEASPIKIILLAESLSVSAVDWTFLARGQK